MASKTAENVACVQILASLDGKDVMNDFYYRFASQPTHNDLVELTESIADVVVENWLDRLPISWFGRFVFGFDMTTPTGANAVADGIAGVQGTSTGQPRPNNTSLAIARKNGLRGRAGNGRIFWMGISGSVLADENYVTQSFVDAVLTSLQTIDAAAIGLDWEPVILSFQKDGVVSTEATVYPLFTWSATNRRLDTRRKRMPNS